MQIMTVGMAEAQQERQKKRDRLAKSRSARWRNNTRILLALPFRFTAMVWDELKDRRLARLAKKLFEQPPYKPLVLRNGTRSSQTQSKLLALPAEIRLMIWERVVGGKLIVLHRKGGKLMHRSLEREDAASVTNATAQMVRQTRLDSTATPTTSKVRFLALLQTCQMIYLETIMILYQSNTFICLDHRVISSLYRGPTSYNMPLIRSLQIHFIGNQFLSNLEGQMFRSPWENLVSENISNAFHQAFPKLRTLSIFLQGRLLGDHMYEDMLKYLRSVYQDALSVHIMALELPNGHFAGSAGRPFFPPDPIARVLVGSKCVDCGIVQPSRDPHIYPPEGGEDKEVTSDIWRVGRLQLRPDDEPEAIMTLHYAVLDPEDEEEDEPPLLWDVSRTW